METLFRGLGKAGSRKKALPKDDCWRAELEQFVMKTPDNRKGARTVDSQSYMSKGVLSASPQWLIKQPAPSLPASRATAIPGREGQAKPTC